MSVSAVLLCGLTVAALIKWARLKVWHALACCLFGFFLASSAWAPDISRVVTSVTRAVTG